MKTFFNFLISKYNSKEKYLILGYLFMVLGVFFTLTKEKNTYELLYIVSITQFAIYYLKKYFFDKKNELKN